MHIDIPTVILGMATLTAIVGALMVVSELLRINGPWPPNLGAMGSALWAIFGALTALYLIAGYIIPEDFASYDQLVANRPMYTVVLAIACVITVGLWRMTIRWKPPESFEQLPTERLIMNAPTEQTAKSAFDEWFETADVAQADYQVFEAGFLSRQPEIERLRVENEKLTHATTGS